MSGTDRLHPPRRRRVVLASGPLRVGLRFDRRGLVMMVVAGVVALAAVVVTVAVGRLPVAVADVLPTVFGHGSPRDDLVINTLRLPRVVVALFVGAALGMSGAIFQGITQNALVAPDIIGINSGASVAVVGVVVLGNAGLPPTVVSFAGALAVASVVYVLSLRSGLSRYRMVLIGIGVNATLGGVIIYLLTRATLTQVLQLNRYLLGDTAGATWTTVAGLVPAAAVLLLAGMALGPALQALQLGDDMAVSVGARVGATRLALIVVGVGLAAVAVAAAGPVGFVAFVAPHLARALARTSTAVVLPLSATVGGALVVIADYAAQRVLEPTQLPVGALTVLIGGPYFAVLLLRATRAGVVL